MSVPFYQRSWIRRPPFCSVASGGGVPSWSIEPLVPAGLASGLFTEKPAKIKVSLCMCATTWWPGDWLTSSGLPSPPLPEIHTPRRQRVRSACAAGDMLLVTSASSASPPPADTSPLFSLCGSWRQCSQNACREQCQSRSTRGHGSGGLPSVPWPLAAACRPGLLNLWSRPA